VESKTPLIQMQQQPFYYNNSLGLWRQLTYSNFPFRTVFVGELGRVEQATGTQMANFQNPLQVICLSKFYSHQSTTRWLWVIKTSDITVDGKLFFN
jgi:hypothetical protein